MRLGPRDVRTRTPWTDEQFTLGPQHQPLREAIADELDRLRAAGCGLCRAGRLGEQLVRGMYDGRTDGAIDPG